MKIQIAAKNFKGFHLLSAINRSIDPSQTTRLAKSLDKMGCIRPMVCAYIDFIDGIKKLYIIDGQHLYHALLRNGMEFPYVTIQISDKKDLIEKIALLNASSKNWCMQNYVTAWAHINSNYMELNKLYSIYDFDLSILASILNSNNGSAGGGMSAKIKKGEFEIVDKEENIKILDHLTDVLKIAPRMNRFENKYLCTEYVNFLRNTTGYNHNTFLLNLQKHKKDLDLTTQGIGKLKELFTKIAK